MDIQIETFNGVTVLRLKGLFDSSTRGSMEIEMLSLISYGSKLLLDLSEVDYISNAGLAFLLEYYERCEREGASLALSNPSDPVREELSKAWLANLSEDTIRPSEEIPIYNSLEAGIEALHSETKLDRELRGFSDDDTGGGDSNGGSDEDDEAGGDGDGGRFPESSYTLPDLKKKEEVHFSAFYPKEVTVEKWHTLLVYTLVPSELEAVRKDARKFEEEIGKIHESKPTSTQLARGTEITIVPSCEGVTFNPERITFKWLEDQHRSQFRMRADASLADMAGNIQVTIYVGPLIVGTLKMGVLFNKTETGSGSGESEEVSGQMYYQDDIFISYSHLDTEIVKLCKMAYEALGHNVLIDFETLRSGQKWNAELMRMIERANIFQLFWSENSSKSKYCRQEWQYALKLNKGEGFIRPVFWKEPIPDPPAELSDLHFDYAGFIVQE